MQGFSEKRGISEGVEVMVFMLMDYCPQSRI
jgi:hypothetical protein